MKQSYEIRKLPVDGALLFDELLLAGVDPAPADQAVPHQNLLPGLDSALLPAARVYIHQLIGNPITRGQLLRI